MTAFGFKGPDEGLGDAFERWLPDLKAAGFSWIEVRAPEGPDPVWEARLREWQERHGWSLSVHGRFFGVNLSSPNARVRRAAVEVAWEDLMFAARIGAQRLNLHAGDVNWYDVPPPDHPDYSWMIQELNRLRAQHLQAVTLSLAEIGEKARTVGVEVVVENLYKPWELLRTPEEVRGFFESLDPSVGFTLDTGHALLAGWPPVTFLHALNSRVRHFHLHWNDGAFDVHDFPDLSEASMQELLRSIGRITPWATLVIEIVPGSPKGAIERFLEWPARAKELLTA